MTKPALNPTVSLFLKLTVAVALAIVLLFIAVYLLKIVFVAAIIAAVAVGGILLYNFIRRRSKFPVIR
ncbi:MAG TPA: hypothetical protein VN909_06685 [Candidatus Dormibacteraeota bacterium]|nr:hypothetical protein [Candidatus Dormibacteraeota bacterium]